LNESGFFTKKIWNKFYVKQALLFIFLLLLSTRLVLQAKNFNSGFWYTHLNKPYHVMYAFVAENTNPKAVFLLVNTPSENDHLYFSRNTRRDRFAVEKLVPAGGLHLAEWYLRMKEKEAIAEDINHLASTLHHYKIDYVLSYKKKLDLPYLELVFSNKVFFIYKTHEP